MSDPRTEWAERLGAPARATPEEAGAAFLRALPDAEFVPYSGTAAALNALAGTAVPVGDGEAARDTVRAEVAALAAHYWQLDPVDRRAALEALQARVGTASEAARLRALEPGLNVVTDPLPDPEAEELAVLVRELFVLPPRERGVRRNTWLAEHTPDSLRWCAAHNMLRTVAPEVAALDPQLAAVLADGKVAEAFAAGFGATPLPEPDPEPEPPETQWEARNEVIERQWAARHATAEAADRANAGTVLRSGWWILLAVVFVVRVASSLSSSSSSPPRQSWPVQQPSYTVPADKLPALNGTYISTASISECEQYERDRSRRIPTQYANWVIAGRPRTPGFYNSQRPPARSP